uniref:ADP-dependent glucokinase-like n=1 Tax=Phallusia mammillata TaxID=59560 RepID=A0A6F9D6L0_9ASCI|nr:ADP-dependent glucokinase-like [Phallusia mammillata]
MVNSIAKFGGTVALVAVLFSIWTNRKPVDLKSEIPNILDSLRKAEKKVEVSQSARVAVGFGGCVDIFVDAVPLLDAAKIGCPKTPKHHKLIHNNLELSEGFAYFFKHGAAAERYMSNKNLFRQMVSTAHGIKGSRTQLGGNAPVMANRFAMEGADVLLGAQGSPDLTQFLNPEIKMAGGNVNESDIHLIMEYKTGEKWGKYESIRANRYIIHSDNHNPTIHSLESFAEAYKAFKPKLLVVGGLQMMENFPFKSGVREARLEAVQKLMEDATKNKGLTHFEFASFVDESLIDALKQHVFPFSDSIGLNEQELPNMLSYLQYGNITVLSDAYPRVATVLDQLRSTYRLLWQNYRRVSRIHVHTLPFQAILTRKSSPWKNTMSAAAHASLTANRYVCGNDMVDLETTKLLLDESFSTTVDPSSASKVPLKPYRPVSCWDEEIEGEVVLICIAPNLVCTKVHKTAGGGDNISSAGLAFQI